MSEVQPFPVRLLANWQVFLRYVFPLLSLPRAGGNAEGLSVSRPAISFLAIPRM